MKKPGTITVVLILAVIFIKLLIRLPDERVSCTAVVYIDSCENTSEDKPVSQWS
jgi:hypothetical protein